MDRELKKRGVVIQTGTTVDKLEHQDGSVKAVLKDGTSVVSEKILVSVGRGFNTSGIGLEKAGVELGPRGGGHGQRPDGDHRPGNLRDR